MSYFTISSILISITAFSMAIFMFSKSGGRKTSIIWGFFCIAVSIWGIGGYKFSTAISKEIAFYWWQVAYIGVIFAPVLFSHFVFEYLKLNKKPLLSITYIFSVILLALTFFKREIFLGDLRFVFNEFYTLDWTKYKSSIWLIFYIYYYWFLLLYGFGLLLVHFINSSGLRRQQMKYFIVGMSIGWLGPHGYFFNIFGLDIYPWSNFLIAIYPIIIGYAIVKFRLMDITMAITRTGIFVVVYSFVLGIPFAIAFGLHEKLMDLIGAYWWMAPLVSSTVLATVGPFVYLYIQKKAEDKIFQEQRRYQATLRQASIGMGRVKDLHRLVNLIVHIVTRTVRLEHSLIYLYDKDSEKFVLSAFRSHKVRFQPQWHIGEDAAIVSYLKEAKDPVVYEEIKQRTKDYGDLKLARLENELRDLNAALALPSFVDDKLLAIIILGEKVSKELYSQGDLAVFSILANQAALAIENAQFYVDMKRTHEQLFKAEKMATIGTMADGLSHQINNRLHALGFIAGDVLDTIKLKRELFKSPELSEIAVDIEHALKRIEDNVSKGGEIVRGLMKYTRKNEEGVAAVELDQLVTAALDMTQFKVKPGEMTVIREYGALPKIRGNFTQLQEVFFNLIDNAYDAMMQRKADLKEPGYKAIVRISAESSHNGKLNVFVEDNGIGIKDDDKHKLFTPFFTTKLSSKKGTGLGLYVIQKLIEENHGGGVHYASRYKEGTKVHLTLPIAADVKSKEGIKNA